MCYSSLHVDQFDYHPSSGFISHPSMKKQTKSQSVEPEKIIAERINGWAAMLGFFAAVGAYLTTGQIIPGYV